MHTEYIGWKAYIREHIAPPYPGIDHIIKRQKEAGFSYYRLFYRRAYHAKELAGKKATFHCKLHEIRVKVPYELDDVFAKEVGGCETLEEMREPFEHCIDNN